MARRREFILREDADPDARRAAAAAIAESLRPASGMLFVELGDRHPERSDLLKRARELQLRTVDRSGVVWEGSADDDSVWSWAIDALPWASCWELTADRRMIVDAVDSLSPMWVLVQVERRDLREWLVDDVDDI